MRSERNAYAHIGARACAIEYLGGRGLAGHAPSLATLPGDARRCPEMPGDWPAIGQAQFRAMTGMQRHLEIYDQFYVSR